MHISKNTQTGIVNNCSPTKTKVVTNKSQTLQLSHPILRVSLSLSQGMWFTKVRSRITACCVKDMCCEGGHLTLRAQQPLRPRPDLLSQSG